MPQTKIINKFGTLIGWNNVTCNVLSRDIEGITEIEYDDEFDMNNEHGSGSFPVGQSMGNYNAKASISLYVEETIALQKSLPPGKRLQQIAPFDISIVYEYDGQVLKDVMRNCRFKTNGRSTKQGEGKMIHKYDLLISHVDYNV